MNWTNLKANFRPFFFTLLLCFGLTLTLKAQEKPFAKLKEKFEQGQVFNAKFNHQSIDSYTGDTVSSSGRIWVGEQRYKVRGKHQTVVVNGKTSKVYDNRKNRVIISKYVPSEDDFAPSRILGGIDTTFTVEKQEMRDNQYYIRLASDDPFAIYKKVEINLSKNLNPQKIRAVDPVDNIITTTFRDGEFIDPRKEIFRLDYPEDAKVVDMRN